MLAPYSAKLDWNEYLRSAHVVEGVGQHIDRMGRGVQKSGSAVISSIDANTTRIVASQQAVAGILERGMEGIQNHLQYQQAAMEDLQAEFSYQSGLKLDQQIITNTTLAEIEKILENHCKIQARPVKRDHMDRFLMGCERLERGLLEKALDSFHAAESVDDAHFFTQLHLGKLYLYGVNDRGSVVDPEKAEKHLRQAADYGESEAKRVDQKMQPLAAEAYLHASMACYLQATRKGQPEKIYEAYDLIRKSIELNPHSGEVFYLWAKYSVVNMALKQSQAERGLDTSLLRRETTGEYHNHHDDEFPLDSEDVSQWLFANELDRVATMVLSGHQTLRQAIASLCRPPDLATVSESDWQEGVRDFKDDVREEIREWRANPRRHPVLRSLEDAIKIDRRYALKAAMDEDFDLLKPIFNSFIANWSAHIKWQAEDKLNKTRKSLDGTVMEFVDAEIFLKEYRALQTLHEKIQNMPPIRLEEVAPSYYGRTDNYKQKELTSAGESLKRQRENIESQITSGYKQLREAGGAFLDVNKAWDFAVQAERNYTTLKEEMAKEPARLILGRKQELATIRRLVSGYGSALQNRAANGQCTVCGQEGLFGSAFMKKKDGLCFCKEHKNWPSHVTETVFGIFGRSVILSRSW